MDLAAKLGISFHALLIAYGILVSATVFLAARWRLRGVAGAAMTIAVALALAAAQWLMMDPAGFVAEIVSGSFIVVPAVLMFAAARSEWMSRRSWLLLLVGPIAFILSYVCVCTVIGYGAHVILRVV